MPLTRYQVRNEYSLADPELYRAADKDDPEALLEGVAMAGLIGVLRQLGDLAEFAAEIFHDLHEELMATAARGHGLMVRVQQIEAEFPSVEKEFLSQTSHSSFFYNTGVDWHPNLRIDHNLITQGDLPRFVMDSYEECRGPPRLFLLDKFDVAGAGACLKRYTDPSFFKVESSISGMSNAEYQREKRSRKTKKKGSRWKNGATPEVMATPHAKLHQLFLEERVENHSNDPARRVKLKKRLNGFPFHSRTGKSYMEKFLMTPIPDHDDVREISVSSSPVKLPANITGESGTEVIDISAMSPDKDVPQKMRSPWSSPDSEIGHIPSINEIAEDDNYGISKASKFSSIAQIDDVLSALHEEVDKKEILVEGERKVKGSVDGYQSDDVASEVDNYVDALATMDSEMETDSEYRANSDRHFLNIVDQGMSSDANEELHDLQTHSSDSQSIANSTAMDDGNSSSRKGKSSLSYSDSFNLAENAQSDGETSVKTSPSAELSKPDFVNLSYDHVNGDAPLNQAPRHSDHDDVCDENADTSSYKSEFAEPSSSSCLTNLTPIFLPVDSGNHLMEVSSPPDLDVLSSNFSKHNAGYTSAEENMIHVAENLPCTSNLSDRPFQSRDDGHSELPLRTGSVDEVDDADSNISHASLHLPSILKLAPVEESNDMMQREHEEKESPRNLVDNLIQSLSSLPSHTEEHHLDRAKPEQEGSGPHINPEGIVSEINDAPEEIASSSAPILDSSQTSNFVGLQLGASENDHSHENGSEEVCFSYLREEKLDGASSIADVEELGGFSSGVDLAGKDDIDLKVTAEFQNSLDPPPVHDVSLSDVMNETVQFKAMFMPTAVAGSDLDGNGYDASSIYPVPAHLQGESSFFLQDSNQDSTEINETSPEHLQESAMEKVVGQQAVASSDLETMSCNTVHSDDSKSEVYHSVSDITPETISGYSLHIAQATAVPFSSYQCQQDAELKPLQQINVIEKDEDAPLDQKVEPQDDYLNVKSWHGEFSESISSQQTDVIQDAEDTLSSSMRHLAEIGTLLDQKFESENDQCVISCHDQVVESKSSQQIDFVDKEDDVSSHSHHVVKLRIPPEHEQVPDSKLSQQINLMDEEQDAISSPTLRVAKHRNPSEENIELQNHQSDAESRHEQVSQSKSALQIDVIENAEDFIAELKTPLEENGHVDVESWHNQDSESKSSQQFNAFENAEDGVSSPPHPIAELNSHLEQQVEFESDQSDLQSRHDLNSELKNSEQVKVTECSEITLSSVSHPIAELNTPIEQTVGLQDHYDEKFRHANEATTAPLSLVEREQSSSHVDQDRQIVPSSEAYALHLPSQPSVLSFLPQLSVSKQANDPLRSNLPSVGLLSEVSQINLDEMPPLPPLPPMQWRLGKAQHAFSAPERNSFGQFLDSNPPMFSSTTAEKSQSGQLAIEHGISYPLTPSFPHSVTEDDNSQHVFKSLAEYVVRPDLFSPQAPGLVKNRISEDDVTISSSFQSMTQVSVLPIEHSGKSESVLLASEGGKTQPSANPFSPGTNLEGTSSTFPSCSLPETPVEPLDESAPERILEDDKLQGISIVSGEQTVTFSSTNMSPPVLQDKQQRPVFSSSEGQSTWPSSSSLPLLPSEEGKTNGNRHMKLPRPRNPLIDAVVAHDKSKLRKVTQRDRPPIGEKVDERDSLLEQIRTKSFNLKPAVVTRPSIQGPKTNLKVAAILEKANAIRQALTGSDEDDDEDNWSDS